MSWRSQSFLSRPCRTSGAARSRTGHANLRPEVPRHQGSASEWAETAICPVRARLVRHSWAERCAIFRIRVDLALREPCLDDEKAGRPSVRGRVGGCVAGGPRRNSFWGRCSVGGGEPLMTVGAGRRSPAGRADGPTGCLCLAMRRPRPRLLWRLGTTSGQDQRPFFVGARSPASEKPGLRHVLDGLAPVGLVLEHRPGGGSF